MIHYNYIGDEKNPKRRERYRKDPGAVTKKDYLTLSEKRAHLEYNEDAKTDQNISYVIAVLVLEMLVK